MKASYEHINPDSGHKMLWISLPVFEFYWHFHREFELTYIVRGSGHRIVGDSMEPFGPGDLLLLGKNLPHTWTSTGTSHDPDACQAIVVQFDATLYQSELKSFNQFSHIRRLFESSARGLSFGYHTSRLIGEKMIQLGQSEELQWLTEFWLILDGLSRSEDCRTLASAAFTPSLNKHNPERIDRIFHYLSRNFASDISLRQVADLVHMTETSFSRFFRRNIGTTFNAYLNDIRIAEACRLLLEYPGKNIDGIGQEAGFRSSTHFNRKFLEKKNCSPRKYRKRIVP